MQDHCQRSRSSHLVDPHTTERQNIILNNHLLDDYSMALINCHMLRHPGLHAAQTVVTLHAMLCVDLSVGEMGLRKGKRRQNWFLINIKAFI